jgi:hypothetical protein
MITFYTAIELQTKYDLQSTITSKILNSLPKQPNGLLLQGVRDTIEYKQANDAYIIAVRNLRALNIYLNKNFKVEYKKYILNKRKGK